MTIPALEIEHAYRRCEEITREEAANFFYGIRLLPRSKRQAMSAVYAFARRVDDIGDGNLDRGAKLGALDAERQLIADYQAVLNEIAAGLKAQNHTVAAELAALPLDIRGFGHVKEANLRRAKVKQADLLARFRTIPQPQVMAAAE